ncbi:GNAT family N-acetyltransferase [Candidatus Micrarchaeota archaeon]|nr:GNAT family N-acetyltransferase [Candidatus Micrarchaeota archaeon]
MVFKRKSKEYIKENITFGFIKLGDLRSIEKLRKGYKKQGGKVVDIIHGEEDVKTSQELQKIAGFTKMNLAKNAGKSLLLVARDKGKVIGWEEIYFEKTRPIIMANYIHPTYRRSGIASSFHGISKIITAEAGYKEIEHGIPENQAAKKALRKAGFIGSVSQLDEMRTKRFRRGAK